MDQGHSGVPQFLVQIQKGKQGGQVLRFRLVEIAEPEQQGGFQLVPAGFQNGREELSLGFFLLQTAEQKDKKYTCKKEQAQYQDKTNFPEIRFHRLLQGLTMFYFNHKNHKNARFENEIRKKQQKKCGI